ncbi:hypothetical protein MRB53_040946 [Persea americana]|nr:hypothetical protein MRB53_040946 [Persea americana]
MVKVQHGWEEKTISDLETLASQSPALSKRDPYTPYLATSTLASGAHGNTNTASAFDQRSHALSAITSQHYQPMHTRAPSSQSSSIVSPVSSSAVPVLAPAPEIVNRGRSVQSQDHKRATTPTPQEQDVADTLLFMSSPAAANRLPTRSRPEHQLTVLAAQTSAGAGAIFLESRTAERSRKCCQIWTSRSR